MILYHHHPLTLPSNSCSVLALPRSDMASFFFLWFMALFSSPPFSSFPVLHLFPSPLPLPPTSVSPCGGLLKVYAFSLSFCFFVFFALVRSLFLLSSSGFLHSLHLSRRVYRKHMFYTRAQRASLVAKVFLVIFVYQTHGWHVVSAHTWLCLDALLVPGWIVSSPAVDPVIAPIVSWRWGTVKPCIFGPSDLSQMGYGHNLCWLAKFCVTLGVLWMLAPFIDAEDRSPLCFVCLITVMHYASQSLQLAFGRGWNDLFCCVFDSILSWDVTPVCFEHLVSALANCLERITIFISCHFATSVLLASLVFVPLVGLSVLLPVSLEVTYVLDGFLRFFFPQLRFALFIAPFSWAAPDKSFSGSIQDFSQIVDDDKDMASEYGSDEGDEPSSPVHPDNDFLYQVAQPGSTPVIISTACMASMPLPASRVPSRASSSHTVRQTKSSSKPYDKKASSLCFHHFVSLWFACAIQAAHCCH